MIFVRSPAPAVAEDWLFTAADTAAFESVVRTPKTATGVLLPVTLTSSAELSAVIYASTAIVEGGEVIVSVETATTRAVTDLAG